MKCVECCKYMTDGCSYGGVSPTGRACVDGIRVEEKDARWDELEWLKLDLENRIHGMTICAHILSEEEKEYLLLFQRCLSVMERIEPKEDNE